MQNYMDLAVQYLPKLVGFLAIFIVTWIVANIVRRVVANLLMKAKLDASLSKFLAGLIRWIVLFVGGSMALSSFGIQTAGLAAVLASAGLALGLAMQGTLSNVAAGVMLLIFRPFKVGDYITVDGQSGFVNAIDLFTTTLDTLDNRRLILPNSNVFGKNMENQTHHPVRRCDIKVATNLGADVHETKKVLENAALSVVSRNKEHAPEAYLLGFGAGCMEWDVRVWCDTPNYFTVCQDTVFAVKDALGKADILPPIPVYQIIQK